MVTPILDLSRTFQRLSQGTVSRIDRVERAYLDEVIARDGWAIISTIRGFLMFEPDRLDRLRAHLDNKHLDASDKASTIRAIASTRTSDLSLRKLMWRMPNGVAYFNVGHTNLTPPTMRAMMEMPDNVKVAMLHDTIPLDRPEFGGPGVRTNFIDTLDTAIRFANRIVVPTEAVKDAIEKRIGGKGYTPNFIVAPPGVHLGIQPVRVERSEKPYFLVLGTVEDRKNQSLMLDLWERMLEKVEIDLIPDLRIVGGIGQGGEAFMHRLRNSPTYNRTVHFHGYLPDDEMKSFLAGATALLYPSHAEGFGLTPLEAATMGIPTVAAPLSAVKETLGDSAVYADTEDLVQWFNAIRDLANEELGASARRRAALMELALPTWEAHFERVFSAI